MTVPQFRSSEALEQQPPCVHAWSTALTLPDSVLQLLSDQFLSARINLKCWVELQNMLAGSTTHELTKFDIPKQPQSKMPPLPSATPPLHHRLDRNVQFRDAVVFFGNGSESRYHDQKWARCRQSPQRRAGMTHEKVTLRVAKERNAPIHRNRVS